MKTKDVTTAIRATMWGRARFADRLATVVAGLGLLFLYSPFAHADSTFGPWDNTGVLRPNGTDTFHYSFNGGELAALALGEAANDGSLTVVIYDEDGDEVGRSDTSNGPCVLTWIPPHREQYTIHVFNGGGGYEAYHLVTN